MSAEAVAVEGLAVAHGPIKAVRSLSFSAQRGEVVTLLGPSGCGKTTTLRAIAGLETPSAGRMSLDGKTVFDAATGIDLPPEQRGLSMVFQSYAIWPHMTVFENVAFGLRARGAKRGDIAQTVQRGLESVGLWAFADRPATRLSGGQQQRVALARAIASNPGLILLDEPLSNLDAQLRVEMRAEFKALQRRLGFTAVYVTHDQEEALLLSDRILVMRGGSVEQVGTPVEIHDRPRTRFVTDFVGVRNIFPCKVERDGDRVEAVLEAAVRLGVRGAAPQGASFVCFRPIAVRLSPTCEMGAAPATLVRATYLGDLMEYELRAGELTILARALARGDLAEGATVFWSVPPDACFLVTE
ncbi:MAG: ABC transporter ATP-binding protein [Hyphomicrobiales bacterium]|nr:ABC transporter ATP-binding protein [Hyphomicrobiales bacterium]